MLAKIMKDLKMSWPQEEQRGLAQGPTHAFQPQSMCLEVTVKKITGSWDRKMDSLIIIRNLRVFFLTCCRRFPNSSAYRSEPMNFESLP